MGNGRIKCDRIAAGYSPLQRLVTQELFSLHVVLYDRTHVKAFVKDVLRSGDLIPVRPGIGDLQCHHFVLCPAADVSELTIRVEFAGDYDMQIFLKRDSFAFPDADPEYSVTASSDGKCILATGPLDKGLWYVTVRCATTVNAKEIVTVPSAGLGHWFSYSGRTDVLNGVPYSIQADWKY